ncbi:MAG: hypothetical protein JSW71_10865, partial [Gemmatimonadota bacterium]
MKRISRRQFSKGLATGAATAALLCRANSHESDDSSWTPQSQQRQTGNLRIRHYASLGSTGITVSDVTFGGGAISDGG